MKRDSGSLATASPRAKQPPWGTGNEKERLGVAICTRCAGVHHAKRWTLDRALHDRLAAEHGVERTVCAACHMQQMGLIEGVVKVHAGWTADQLEQAIHLSRHEEEREAAKNALHRIVSLEASDQGLEITTTTEFLARHLARRLEKTFAGQRVIKQAPGEKFVEILVLA